MINLHSASVGALATVATATLVGACEKKDDCAKFADKAMPVIAKIVKAAEAPPSTAKLPTRAEMIKQCRTATKRDPVIDCVLPAKTKAATEDCFRTALASYAQEGRNIEVKLHARSLAAAAKALFAETSIFPVGKSGWTPAGDCCAQPDKKCAADSTLWQVDPFRELGFEIYDPSAVRVRYEGTATSFTAAVWADFDCDGQEDSDEVARVNGSVEGGATNVTLDPP